MKYNMVVREMIFGPTGRTSLAYIEAKQKMGKTAFEVGLLGLLVGRHSNFEREVMMRAVVQISGDVKETFDEFDKNQDGRVNKEEFRDLMANLGLVYKEKQLEDQFTAICGDDGDSINFQHFKKWYIECEERTIKDMKDLFKSMDLDGNNVLDVYEISHMLKQSQESVAQELERHFKEPKEIITMEEFER